MIHFIRWAYGFVRIVISSENPEIFLNRIIIEGITVWSVKKENSKIYLSISFKDFRKLRNINRTVSVKTKILICGKYGLSILLSKLFARLGVVIGLILVLTVNIFMSNFIWQIEVSGTNNIDNNKIIKACNDLNVKEGSFSKAIDEYFVAQEIARRFDNIAWISINIEGSKLTVNISEASNSKDEASPSNIIALTDGVIKSINYTSGTKCVEIGQAVRKDEVLISGVETIGNNTKFTNSNGEVTALTQRVFKAKINKNYISVSSSERTITRNMLSLFNIKIPLYLCGVKDFKESYLTENKVCLFGTKIPIGIASRRFILSNSSTTKLTEDKAINIAKSEIVKQIMNYKIDDIIKYDISVISDKKYYYVSIDTLCHENIGVKKNIDSSNY